MTQPVKRSFQFAVLALVVAGAMFASGCGQEKPTVQNRASQLFAERCSGCHTLSAAATVGSNGQDPTGPNLDYRTEDRNQVLFAIRNGGFSGAIMPQNIVVGKDAEQVADFVATYAGKKAKPPASPGTAPTGN